MADLPDHYHDDGSAVQEAKPKLKRPPLYSVVLLNDDFALAQRDPYTIAASFHGVFSAGVVNEDSTHRFGRGTEEMPSAAPSLTLIPDQPQISFMDQGRCLQCLPRLFSRQLCGCEAAELSINQWQQLLRRRWITGINP